MRGWIQQIGKDKCYSLSYCLTFIIKYCNTGAHTYLILCMVGWYHFCVHCTLCFYFAFNFMFDVDGFLDYGLVFLGLDQVLFLLCYIMWKIIIYSCVILGATVWFFRYGIVLFLIVCLVLFLDSFIMAWYFWAWVKFHFFYFFFSMNVQLPYCFCDYKVMFFFFFVLLQINYYALLMRSKKMKCQRWNFNFNVNSANV